MTTGYVQMQTGFVAREQKIVSLLQQHTSAPFVCEHYPKQIVSALRQAPGVLPIRRDTEHAQINVHNDEGNLGACGWQ